MVDTVRRQRVLFLGELQERELDVLRGGLDWGVRREEGKEGEQGKRAESEW